MLFLHDSKTPRNALGCTLPDIGSSGGRNVVVRDSNGNRERTFWSSIYDRSVNRNHSMTTTSLHYYQNRGVYTLKCGL
jgi:hypothetical protein